MNDLRLPEMTPDAPTPSDQALSANSSSPLSVALTGNIASGKSVVASRLGELGAAIIDADVLARDAVAPGTNGNRAVAEQFGSTVVMADGTINRAALRKIVFGDAAQREALNAIVHPIVASLRIEAEKIALSRGCKVIVSDIPLLFETRQENDFHAVILVDASESVRLDRLVNIRGLSQADARAMMDAQMPSLPKRAAATWVIDNNGTLDQLMGQTDKVWSQMLDLALYRTSLHVKAGP